VDGKRFGLGRVRSGYKDARACDPRDPFRNLAGTNSEQALAGPRWDLRSRHPQIGEVQPGRLIARAVGEQGLNTSAMRAISSHAPSWGRTIPGGRFLPFELFGMDGRAVASG